MGRVSLILSARQKELNTLTLHPCSISRHPRAISGHPRAIFRHPRAGGEPESQPQQREVNSTMRKMQKLDSRLRGNDGNEPAGDLR